MIDGSFEFATGARVRIAVRLDHDRMAEFDAMIDTGFDGFLSLPRSAIQSFGLTRSGEMEAILGTGVHIWLDTYTIVVMWHGEERTVDAVLAETSPLIGLSLLAGHFLGIEIADAGRVEIRPL